MISMATKKYTLLTTAMWHEGREYRQGDTVEVEQERGEELVALGALRDPSAKDKAEESPSEPDSGGEGEPSGENETAEDSGQAAPTKSPRGTKR